MSLVLLAAGASSRFGLPVKKQWIRIGDEPLWLFVANRFSKLYPFADIILTADKEELPFFKKYCRYHIVPGGETRQESLKNALDLVNTPYVLVSDIARVCIEDEVLTKIIDQKEHADAVVPYLPATDTVVYRNETIDRDEVKLIQTPQLSKTDLLKNALQTNRIFTDDSSAIKAIGGNVHYIPGSKKLLKLTHKEDLQFLSCLKPPAKGQLVGEGFDVHPFEKKRKLILGGVQIEYECGLAGHSDADVVLHALIDALLGAAGFGDIGEIFPDNDQRYKNIDSKILLKECVKLLQRCGFVIDKVDITILAQKPKIAPYKPKIQETIATLLNLPLYKTNVKATTTEKLGFIGRGEGIAAQAVATLHYFDWRNA